MDIEYGSIEKQIHYDNGHSTVWIRLLADLTAYVADLAVERVQR